MIVTAELISAWRSFGGIVVGLILLGSLIVLAIALGEGRHSS